MNRHRRGFTLLEVMIVVLVVAIFFGFAYSTISGTIRVVGMESTVLDMDASANQALQELADTIRPAILPIPPSGGQGGTSTAFVKNVLDTPNMGFNNARGREWLDLLQNGTDCIAFTVPVDFGSDGDFVDSDGYMELGMVLPSGQQEFGANYVLSSAYGKIQDAEDSESSGGSEEEEEPAAPPAGPRIYNYLEGRSVNRFLKALDPSVDLGIPSKGQEVKDTAPRFAAKLTLPNSGRAYALARFVPYRVNASGNRSDTGDVLTMSEATLKYDLNGDGDTTDEFMLGYIELTYSNTRFVISGPSVLLQINTDDSGWVPLFKLVRFGRDDDSLNDYKDGFDEDTGGDYGILIRMLMCDNLGQQDPLVFQRTVPALVRRFETMVKLRNMTVTGLG